MDSLTIEIAAGGIQALPVPVTTVDYSPINGGGALYGYSLRETTGAAVATVELKSGDNVIWEIQLAAGAADGKWFGPMGIVFQGGITVHVIAGSVVGAVHCAYEC